MPFLFVPAMCTLLAEFDRPEYVELEIPEIGSSEALYDWGFVFKKNNRIILPFERPISIHARKMRKRKQKTLMT
jgi:hypothetical protein